MEKARRLIADPPSGWKYGFPKELPDDKRYEDLLRQQGYPEKMMQLALDHSRFWYEDDQGDEYDT